MKSKTIDINKLLTVRHYAELFGVTRQAVDRWMKNGRVDYIVIDGIFFIINEN